MTNDPTRIVRAGYDRLGERYRAGDEPTDGVRRWFLDEVLATVPRGSDVLELGCGAGIDAVDLAAGRTYTGVDISWTMIAAASERVPDARLVQANLTELEFTPASFDAVVSLYVFGHLPADAHRPTFERLARWLRPGGRLLASFPLGADDCVEDDWLGVPMFFGGIGDDETRSGLRDAGFDIELAETPVGQDPNGGTDAFLWVIARKA